MTSFFNDHKSKKLKKRGNKRKYSLIERMVHMWNFSTCNIIYNNALVDINNWLEMVKD